MHVCINTDLLFVFISIVYYINVIESLNFRNKVKRLEIPTTVSSHKYLLSLDLILYANLSDLAIGKLEKKIKAKFTHTRKMSLKLGKEGKGDIIYQKLLYLPNTNMELPS